METPHSPVFEVPRVRWGSMVAAFLFPLAAFELSIFIGSMTLFIIAVFLGFGVGLIFFQGALEQRYNCRSMAIVTFLYLILEVALVLSLLLYHLFW